MTNRDDASGPSASPARPPETDEAFVALGSNDGDRLATLRGAVHSLAAHTDIDAVRPSRVYEAEAHTSRPGDTQPAYLNAVVQLQAGLSPGALLRLAWRLEAAAGRDRASEKGRWQPRPLDVDLLVVGRATRQSERLMLPHPRLAERRFVLRPWVDLAPNLRVPAPFESTTSALLVQCTDRAALHRIDAVLR
jgi:2-amino-4-hydroxy-6-hydroxymethyldihydropteridine diphosphokinase